MRSKFSTVFCTVLAVFLLMGLIVAAPTALAEDNCEIPASGPWPPCATNGGGGSAPDSASDCVIPSSGPWPPCATSGGGGSAPDSAGDCVIPSSGPWPPCASSGGGSAPDNAGGCVIPTSGPWPPCASGGGGSQPAAGAALTGSNNVQVVHEGRGAKQSTIAVSGAGQIARLEVVIDFTYSGATCAAGGSVEKEALGYTLISPSGTEVELISVGELTGVQTGARVQMRFADGGNVLSHVASGRFNPSESLSAFNGENAAGEWRLSMFKQAWDDAICQHSATLHITIR